MPDLNDRKTQDAIAGIYNGTLAHSIKRNSRYAVVGFAVGFIGGFLIAGWIGKSRLVGGLIGAGTGTGLGLIMSPKNKTKNKTKSGGKIIESTTNETPAGDADENESESKS